jgi:hypothetical protein
MFALAPIQKLKPTSSKDSTQQKKGVQASVWLTAEALKARPSTKLRMRGYKERIPARGEPVEPCVSVVNLAALIPALPRWVSVVNTLS